MQSQFQNDVFAMLRRRPCPCAEDEPEQPAPSVAFWRGREVRAVLHIAENAILLTENLAHRYIILPRFPHH
jgi:hypothetical protein